jgi:hypothetical protein
MPSTKVNSLLVNVNTVIKDKTWKMGANKIKDKTWKMGANKIQ